MRNNRSNNNDKKLYNRESKEKHKRKKKRERRRKMKIRNIRSRRRE